MNGMSMFEIYKRGQGKWTRGTTFIGAMFLTVVGAYVLSQRLTLLRGYSSGVYLQFGIPAALIAGMAILMFWVVNRPRSADFLIATEGEMKKVSWSSRKEVIGSTKVVIVTALILAAVLFAVDILFIQLFRLLGIMG